MITGHAWLKRYPQNQGEKTSFVTEISVSGSYLGSNIEVPTSTPFSLLNTCDVILLSLGQIILYGNTRGDALSTVLAPDSGANMPGVRAYSPICPISVKPGRLSRDWSVIPKTVPVHSSNYDLICYEGRGRSKWRWRTIALCGPPQ